MTFRRILVPSLAFLIAASALSAFQAKPVDLTGVWTGTLTPGTAEPGPAHIVLKQTGTDLAGTAGPDPDRQAAIANGKVTTVKDVTSVTFEATQPNGVVLAFDLKLVDGRLKGKVALTRNGEKRDATLDVGRAK